MSPERAEYWTTEVMLRRKLVGKICVGLTITSASRYAPKRVMVPNQVMNALGKWVYDGTEREEIKPGGIPGIEYFTGPMKIVNITTRGKKLIYHFLRSDGTLVYMISFFGMAGRWQYVNSSHSGVIMEIGHMKQMKHATLTIITDRIYYHDQRHMGTLQILVTDAEMKHAFKNVGPDLLYDNVSLEQYRTILRNKRITQWPICKYVMDQSRVTSVGNWMKAEILYGAGIAPTRTLASLSDVDVEKLYRWSLHILAEGCAKGGLTIGDFYAPDGSKGLYLCMAYDKTTCPRGHVVTKGVYGDGRTTHWCATCQC